MSKKVVETNAATWRAAQDDALREHDARDEEKYRRRAAGVPAEEASAIALQMSDERRIQEDSAVEEGHASTSD